MSPGGPIGAPDDFFGTLAAMTRTLSLPSGLTPTALALDAGSTYVAGLAYEGDDDASGTETLVEIGADGDVSRTHDIPGPLLALSVHRGDVLGVTTELHVIRWPRAGEFRVIACPSALSAVLDERLAHDELHPTAFAHLAPDRVRSAALGFYELRTPVALARDPLRAWAIVSPRVDAPGTVWDWTEAGWAERGPAPALFGVRAAWHGVRNVVVLVGRAEHVYGPARVAEWDGVAWVEHPLRLTGARAHLESLALTALAGGPRAVGVQGKGAYVYGRDGVFGLSHGRADEQGILEPTALERTETALILHSLEREHEGDSVATRVHARDVTGTAQHVDEVGATAPAAGAKPRPSKPARGKSKPSAKKASTVGARGRPLGELFPDLGFATMVLDALMPFGKQRVQFDLDAWTAEGLAAGRLAIAPTDDDDPVRAWKEQNAFDVHPELARALLALEVPRIALAKVDKLDLTSPPKKVIRKLAPQFDGESELGNAADVRGIAHLTGLKTINVSTLLDFSHLVDAPALEEVSIFAYDSAQRGMTRSHEDAVAALEKRGIRVAIKRL
jgi:hypothetical protein